MPKLELKLRFYTLLKLGIPNSISLPVTLLYMYL